MTVFAAAKHFPFGSGLRSFTVQFTPISLGSWRVISNSEAPSQHVSYLNAAATFFLRSSRDTAVLAMLPR